MISLDFSAVFTCPRVSVLAEAQALTRACPVPRYGVDGPLARIAVVGTPYRLAVAGHHFPGDQVGHRLGPGHEALLELLRVQPGADVAEGVVGRDAVGQFQEGLEPFQIALAEQFDVDPGVGAADDGADGNCNDVQQLVPLAPVDPGVLQRLEIIHNGRALPLSHHSPLCPSHPWTRMPGQVYQSITRLP